MTKLEELRKELQNIDDEFMAQLVKRIDIARAMRHVKKESQEEVYQPEQQRLNRQRFADFAKKNNLDERHFNSLYNLLHSVAVEEQLKDL